VNLLDEFDADRSGPRAGAAARQSGLRSWLATRFADAALLRATAVAALALVLGAGCAQSAKNPEPAPAQSVKNIVLVHGAFADGSSWAKIIPILQSHGFNVTAVQNPLTSFADDVAATNRVLAAQTGPVILVGHSWGGVVITEAGMDPKVVGLVYVAAFGPDVGEVVGDLGKAYPPPPALAAPIVDKQGFMTLSTDAIVKHFAQDLPAAEARVVAATQGPINAAAFGTKVSSAAWKTKPSWYIVSKLDGAIAPDAERFFAKRMKATTTELDTSHVPMLSKPEDVAAVIMDAAAKAPH
jgi:pimeloyl-ACP methyl ester carboxylesterase